MWSRPHREFGRLRERMLNGQYAPARGQATGPQRPTSHQMATPGPGWSTARRSRRPPITVVRSSMSITEGISHNGLQAGLAPGDRQQARTGPGAARTITALEYLVAPHKPPTACSRHADVRRLGRVT